MVPRIVSWPTRLVPVSLFGSDQPLKAHPAYRQAKAGDESAALDLVLDLAADWLDGQRTRLVPGLLFVAPHAREAAGDNAIPQTLAAVCAAIFEGQVDTSVVQSDRVYHTGADPMERLAARAQFSGHVQPGVDYVLVDDVTTLGGTLAELANFVQLGGGRVRDALVLVNAGRDSRFAPVPRNVQLLEKRYGDEFFNIFGIQPAALTANEARYLVGFRSLDEIRNRLAAARQEIDRRLRSKGIARTSEGATSGTPAAQALKAAAPSAASREDKPHRA